MKRLLIALALASAPLLAATEDAQVAARRSALELAGAWANDGFKIRDGHITGEIKPGESKLVRVNLYSGNQYWFTAATAVDAAKAKKLSVQVFDESGRPVAFQTFQDEGRAAAGFAPSASGPYYVKVEMLEGEPGAFALVYSYK